MSAAVEARRVPVTRWVPWLLMALLVGASLFVAATDGGGPRTSDDRARAIAASVRCPTCRGQSVLESSAVTAAAIREEIDRRIEAGQTDEEIRGYLVSRYGESILLNPPRSGVAGLVWVLPVAGLVAAGAGIGFTVRRWQRQPGEPIPGGAPPIEESTTGSAPAEPQGRVLSGASSRRGQKIAAAGLVAAVAAAAGVGVAVSAGERRPGATITGSIDETSSDRLAEARLLMGRGEALEAVKLYDAVLADDPANREALAYKGWLLVLAGLVPEGVEHLDRAVEAHPTYVDARFFRAFTRHRHLDDPQGALDDIRVVIANDPPPDLTPAAVELLRQLEAELGL